MIDGELPAVAARLASIRGFQGRHGVPTADVTREAPAAALHSLEEAVQKTPGAYRPYLQEAVSCYSAGLYRGSILMVWAATIGHLHEVIGAHHGGIAAFEAANHARFGTSKAYRRIRRTADLLYLRESQQIQLGEDAGMYNKNARKMLIDRLDLRNLCGHPTGYEPGREETVVFVESLTINILGGVMLAW